MNMQLFPPRRTLIPDSAPFTPEQQAWLNGFFEAVLSASANAPAVELAAAGVMEAAPAVVLADNDSAPWHDPSLPLDERLALRQRAFAALLPGLAFGTDRVDAPSPRLALLCQPGDCRLRLAFVPARRGGLGAGAVEPGARERRVGCPR